MEGPPTLKAPRPSKDSLVSYAGKDLHVTSGTLPHCAGWELTVYQETSLMWSIYIQTTKTEYNPAAQFIRMVCSTSKKVTMIQKEASAGSVMSLYSCSRIIDGTIQF